MDPQKVMAASSVVSALAIIVLIVQAVLTRQQIQLARKEAENTREQINVAQQRLEAVQGQAREDHERSRREKAIDLLFEWAKNIKEEGGDARRFCEILSEDQLKRLYTFKDDDREPEIRVEMAHKDLLTRALSKYTGRDAFQEVSSKLILERNAALYIRWNFIAYFNVTEAVISAWTHNTADRQMIQEQFKFLYGKDNSQALVAKYVKASQNAWPSIASFVARMYRKTADQRQKAAEEYNVELDRDYGELGVLSALSDAPSPKIGGGGWA